MISRLRGTVESIDKDSLIVMVGGVGLKVRASATARERAGLSRSIELFTHLQVRENEIGLYGFASEDELALFELLISVTGIGPKVALSVLASASPDRLRRAIAAEELDLFTRVPGVGPKTAKNIVFHLKDKVGSVPGASGLTAITEDDTELLAALTSLGYSVVEAQTALASVPRDSGASPEERLRLALAYFARP